VSTADIFGPEPLPTVHRNPVLAAQAAHRSGGHGQQGEEGKFQMPPRKNPNTVPIIIGGVGGGALLIAVLIIGLVMHSKNNVAPTPAKGTPTTAVQPTPVQPSPVPLKLPGETPAAATTPTEAGTTPTEGEPPAKAEPDPPAKTISMRGAYNVVNDVAVSAEYIRSLGDSGAYVAGHVSNGTGKEIRVLEVIVPIKDRETKKEVGRAIGRLLNIPPGKTAPYVAYWGHEEGVTGTYDQPTCQIDPLGSAQGLPPIQATKPYPSADPNGISTDGKIIVDVTNRGVLQVSQVELIGVLLNKDGKIVGAAKGSIGIILTPGEPKQVTLPWSQCAGSLVDSCEVWAQAKSD